MPDDVSYRDWSGMSALHWAATGGAVEQCRELVARGADPEAKNIIGMSPVMIAAARGHLEIVKCLTEAVADINTPLNRGWAAMTMGPGLVGLGLGLKPLTLVRLAAHLKRYKVCQHLIHSGADLSSVKEYLDDLLAWAANEGDITMCLKLSKAGGKYFYSGTTPLSLILASGDKEHEVYNMLSIYQAARDEEHDKCEHMIESGLDPNIADEKGLTPLYFLCRNGNNKLAIKFFEKHADVNTVGCLQVALEMNHIDVAETLLLNGCDVNKLYQGRTALMNAAKTSSTEALELLLNLNDNKAKLMADPEILDENGFTALDYALKTDNIKNIGILCDATKTFSKNTVKSFAQLKIDLNETMEKFLLKNARKEVRLL